MRYFYAGVAVVLVACSDSGTTPPLIARVVVSPASDTLPVTAQQTLEVVALDADGSALPNVTFTWISSDVSRASVSASGIVTALAQGSVIITASAGGHSGSATLALFPCSPSPMTIPAVNNPFDLLVSATGIATLSPTLATSTYQGVRVLFAGGLLLGTDPLHLALSYDTHGVLAPDITGLICGLQLAELKSWARLFVNPAASAPPGLAVTQEIFAVANTSYLLFRYVFRNRSAVAITSFYAGFVVDWDLTFDNNPGSDLLRPLPSLGIAEAEEPDTVAYPQRFGLVTIAGSGVVNSTGWLNGTDPTTRADYFGHLAGSPALSAIGPGDIRQLMGRGPVTIPAGGRYVLYVAVVGADNAADFALNVAAARVKANSLGF